MILGSLTIDPNKKLTINKGCRIYVHADAPIIVDGTLEVNGVKDTVDRVYFRGDRLMNLIMIFLLDGPVFISEVRVRIMYLIMRLLKMLTRLLAVQDPSQCNPKLTLNECIIDNAYDAGIIAVNTVSEQEIV